MKQSHRIQVAKNVLEILKKGYYTNKSGQTVDVKYSAEYSEIHTELFTPESLQSILDNQSLKNEKNTTYEVNHHTTLDSARKEYSQHPNDIICLNFASAKNPGGGFLNGAQAQEESIARSSGLYPCLLKANDYYKVHKDLSTCLYTDHMIYSPKVPVIMDEEGEILDQIVPISIITSSAVNAGVVKRNEPKNIDLIEPVMRTRIRKLLALSHYKNHQILVLGAWGCGVFQNEPELIAKLFHEVLSTEFEGVFEKIIFAIKSRDERFINPFNKYFV